MVFLFLLGVLTDIPYFCKSIIYTIYLVKKHFKRIVQVAIVSVYLIFIAGSVVRMTGSGMGCPDWPKCFGYYIPPTDVEQLLWKPNTTFVKGAVIIIDETLYVANNTLQTKEVYNSENWSVYTKHDYAVFNVFHTWTEYINRLASVLSGFVFLFLIAGATRFWKENKKITLFAFAAFFLMLFEAWLGKTVVDSVLKPSVITIHMVAGLMIIGLLLKLLQLVSKKDQPIRTFNKTFNTLLTVSIILSVIQIALGTQVRQFVDEQVKLFGFENKQMSLYNPSIKFYVHRSFTIAIVLLNFFIFYKNEMLKFQYKIPTWILILLGFEAMSGILMFYSDFPFGTQAVHLLSGALLFGMQFYLRIEHGSLKRK